MRPPRSISASCSISASTVWCLTSHILAGVKLVIAAAFVAYLIEFARSWVTGREADRETIDVVLILAVVGIIICVLPALALGDAAMIRLYATQMLLVAGAITVIVVERHLAARGRALRARSRPRTNARPCGSACRSACWRRDRRRRRPRRPWREFRKRACAAL